MDCQHSEVGLPDLLIQAKARHTSPGIRQPLPISGQMCKLTRLLYFESFAYMPWLLFLLSYEGTRLAYRASKLLKARY